MNIEINKKINTSSVTQTPTSSQISKENDGKFASELKTLSAEKKSNSDNPSQIIEETDSVKETTTDKTVKTSPKKDKTDKTDDNAVSTENSEIDNDTKKTGEVKNTTVPFEEKEKLDINKQNKITNQEVKPEPQVSISQSEQKVKQNDEVFKSEKNAKHHRNIKQEEKQNHFIEQNSEFDNLVKTNLVEEDNGKFVSNNKEINIHEEIDETLAATTRVITGLENIVKEIKSKTGKESEPKFAQEINPKIAKKTIKEPHKQEKYEIFEKRNSEDVELIDNSINIQEKKDIILPQMNANMNFNSNGQPFSDFIDQNKEKSGLNASHKDLEEEKAILSTITENVAIANKNNPRTNLSDKNKSIIHSEPTKQIDSNNTKNDEIEYKKVNNVFEPVNNSNKQNINKKPVEQTKANVEDIETEEQFVQPKTKTVTTDEGVKKVDKQTNITVETVVKYETVIMDKSDVDFFAKLVENGEVEIKEAQHSQKSANVSKTLADLLAKAMQDNKPIRIDFDNNISIIIKVSRDGKISADFLPSSQIAETYLKENLPLLRQRFDDNNIEYDSLNQRKQNNKQDNQENRRKGRKNE